jgi:hypothetical protein
VAYQKPVITAEAPWETMEERFARVSLARTFRLYRPEDREQIRARVQETLDREKERQQAQPSALAKYADIYGVSYTPPPPKRADQ